MVEELNERINILMAENTVMADQVRWIGFPAGRKVFERLERDGRATKCDFFFRALHITLTTLAYLSVP